MTADAKELRKQYKRALELYLRSPGEDSLKQAYDLGRLALDAGMGLLEMTTIQNRALRDVLSNGHCGEMSMNTVKAAQDFFTESLSPFEMTHRGFRDANATLRRLNERLNERLEEVTRRIATALHDEAWQLLSVVCIDLDLAARTIPASSKKHLQNVRASLNELEQHLRRLSHELRPRILDDLGLMPALRFLAEGISKRSGISITVEGTADKRFHASLESNLYRIVQEALINLSRHASATRACVVLRSDSEKITCQVQDDGIGFDLQEILSRKGHGGLGLLGIQERVAGLGGELRIDTAPQRGTSLIVDIPLAKFREDKQAANE